MTDPKEGMANKPVDSIGIGTNDEGGVTTLTPEQYAKAVIQRDADEAIDTVPTDDPLDEEQDEDFADLEHEDGQIEDRARES